MKAAALLLLLLVIGGMAYIRLAPDDPARWHGRDGFLAGRDKQALHPDQADHLVQEEAGAWGLSRLYAEPPEALLARLDAIALASPRTTRLAGSPAEGRITWVTRSAFWGFPDYTTAEMHEAEERAFLTAFARQRYGRRDMGVNMARLADWFARLGG